MELKDQVVSLDLAMRLNELGVGQSSLWWWAYMGEDENDKPIHSLVQASYVAVGFSAFTTSELGELLPYRFNINAIAEGQRTYYMYTSKWLQ